MSKINYKTVSEYINTHDFLKYELHLFKTHLRVYTYILLVSENGKTPYNTTYKDIAKKFPNYSYQEIRNVINDLLEVKLLFYKEEQGYYTDYKGEW